MQRIPLDLAKPGMKLSKPVKNKRDMILCGAGIDLTEDLISRLSKMDIEWIWVEGHPVDTGEPEKSLGQQIDQLNMRFKNVAGDALMEKIKKILLKRLEEKAE